MNASALKAGPMAKDPICGMVVPTATALSAQRGSRTYYFCSQGCRQTFLAPEQELGRMRRRVGIALTGVLALAVLRAAAFIALAAGISLLSWAPVPQLPWLTWGVWLFLLATPVQVIGGWGFYTGAWAALKRRALNMDVLIALGTTVAYLYSVVVVFAPQLLPVGIDERGVYFEVSAVVIAFVLMGKYMEEIIKQRSSAAVRRLLDLQPATATVIREGREMTVPAEAVLSGDLVLVRPGEKVPADGVVLEGSSSVDEALITGESLPVGKQKGSELIGGTINGPGLLRFTATRVAVKRSRPGPLIVPPISSEPFCLPTGRDSPVISASSTDELPSSTTPSAGTFSPGRTSTRSPLSTASAGTVISLPSRITVAVAGCRSSNRRTAAEERCLMISSMYLPIKTKAITTADTSK